MDLRTGQRSPLPTPNADDWRWSPQLTHYAFVQEHLNVNELIVVGARPRARARVAVRGNLGGWTWLDDRHIGVARSTGDYKQELLVLDVAHRTTRVVARGDISSAAWS